MCDIRERVNLSLASCTCESQVYLYVCVQMHVPVCISVRDIGLSGCKRESARVCVFVCLHDCVLILPVKMILQPSLISSSLSKQRKRRLVTPPPLLLSVSSFILCSTSVYLFCVCVCMCARCVCVSVWAQRFYVKLHRKGKSQAESPWQQNAIAAQWTIFCRADPAILSFL